MPNPPTMRALSLPVIFRKGDLPEELEQGMNFPCIRFLRFLPEETASLYWGWATLGIPYPHLPEPCKYAVLEQLSIEAEKAQE